MGNEGFTQTKMWLLKLIGQFSVSASGTHFGMIVYSDEPELICKFSDMRYYFSVSLKLRVLGLEFPDGETRTDKALGMAGRDLYSSSGGERKGVPHVLVVITDGHTAHGSEPYKEVLKPLKVQSCKLLGSVYDVQSNHSYLRAHFQNEFQTGARMGARSIMGSFGGTVISYPDLFLH